MEHLTRKVVAELQAKVLPPETMVEVVRHLEECPGCHELYRVVFRERRRGQTFDFELSGSEWTRDEHPEYKEIAAFVKGSLDREMREIFGLHLDQCPECRRVVAELQDELNQHERGRDGSNQAKRRRLITKGGLLWSWLTGRARHLRLPVISDAGMVDRVPGSAPSGLTMSRLIATGLIGLLIIGVMVTILSRMSARRSGEPGVITGPHPAAANGDESGEMIIATIRDGDRTIVATADGQTTGLDLVPASTRAAVESLLHGRSPERLPSLRNLETTGGQTRAGMEKPGTPTVTIPAPISPLGTVIPDDYPILRWKPVAGATGYRVDIANIDRRESISSGILSPETTSWRSTSPLGRGQLHSWTVTALIDGREVTAPDVSQPEARFLILSDISFDEMRLLQKPPVSRLALTIFYGQHGMLADAHRELSRLARENPQSKEIEQLQAWLKSLR